MKEIWQITTGYTVSDMATFNRIASKIYPNRRTKIYRWLYLVLGIGGMVIGVMAIMEGGSFWIPVISLAIGVLYLIGFFGHFYIMGWQSQNARPKEVETMSFTFDKLGMVVENALGHSRFNPEDIHQVAESKLLFAIFTTCYRQGFVVPKHTISDVDGFRTMLETLFECEIESFKF